MTCSTSAMSKFAKVVSKEMQRYGFDLEIIRSTNTYNPATSSATIQETSYPCRGIIFDLTLQSNGDQTKPNTLIEMGDKQLFIQPPKDDGWYQENEAEAIYPNKDKIKINGKLYKIVTFKQVNPSLSESVLWECYIRG